MTSAPTILTTGAVALRLGFSDDMVRRLCESGKLDGAYRVGVGAHWRVPAAAVERFMDRCRVQVVRR